MSRFHLTICFGFSTFCMLLGCQSSADQPEDEVPETIVEESGEAESPEDDLKSQLGSRLKQLWSENGDAVMSQVEKYLDQNETDLAELEERAKELGEDGLKRWEAYQPKLIEKKKALMQKVQDLKTAGPSKWLEMKDGLDQAWSDFKASMDEAKKALDIP